MDWDLLALLGFVIKYIISNFIAGLLILIYHPYRHSDLFLLLGLGRILVEIGLRYTTLQSEGKRFLIPNYNLFTNTITVSDREK